MTPIARMLGARKNRPKDPLQVNLRRVVWLILFLVVIPTVLLTGFGIALVFLFDDPADLILSLLVVSFAASVTAGSILLVILAGRGARLARIQETFLSRIGHELMTPIAGIRLHAQLLSGADYREADRRSLAAIVREANRLQILVERILRWRKIRSTKHLYDKRPVRTSELLAEVERLVSDPCEVIVDSRVPDERIKVDREAMAEALSNLVNNAVKYGGEAKPPTLTARAFFGWIVFDVADHGPGLPPATIDELRQPFARWDVTDGNDPGGSGLGLAIAHQIVQDHGGRLGAVNRQARGARFYIALPQWRGADEP